MFRNAQDRDSYLRNEFYSNLDEEGGQLDHSGDLMIEKFVNGESNSFDLTPSVSCQRSSAQRKNSLRLALQIFQYQSGI